MSDDPEYRPPRTPLVPPGGADLHERDMTATFAADVTLAQAQARLAEIGQWLPIDGDPAAPLGDLVSFNSTGPLRLGFGGWRDLLLGVQFVNGRGELITAGGRTVKNVAGYDLAKFMVGQRGVFGRIATLTTRTYREPAGALLARHPPEYAVLLKLLPTALRPQWAVLTSADLLCGYVADGATLDWYEANVRASEPAEVLRRSLEEDADHRAALWNTRAAATFRASVPPSRIHEFVTAAGTHENWSADAAFGIVVGPVASPEAAAALRSAARALGGSVTFAPPTLSGRPEGPHDLPPLPLLESTNPSERRIIERLKTSLDPDNTLAPLPWQTAI